MLRRLLSAFTALSLLCSATPAFALIIPGVSRDTIKVRNPARKKIRVNVTDPGVTSGWKLRNDQRKLDLKLLGNAFYNYRRRNKDTNVRGLGAEDKEICRSDARDCTGLLDVREFLKPYMNPLVRDPQTPAIGNGTRYFVRVDWKGKVYLSAPDAEEGWSIREMH